MAIRAAHIAFQDLGEHRGPSTPAAGIDGDIGDLVASVIELQDDDVALAAVHAGMCKQISDEARVHVLPLQADVPRNSGSDAGRVLPVIRCVDLSEAGATPGLQPWLTAPHWWKLVERLLLAAARATFHAGIYSHARSREHGTRHPNASPIDTASRFWSTRAYATQK
jgi:hypothetical protein